MVYRVLLVDDEESIRKSTGRLLRSHGYVVETCATYRDAQREAIGTDPDAVLTDTQLIDDNFPHKISWGFELAAYLRRLNYSGAIIGMSGASPNGVPVGYEKPVGQLYTEAGADAFVKKLEIVDKLDDLLRQMIAKRRPNAIR